MQVLMGAGGLFKAEPMSPASAERQLGEAQAPPTTIKPGGSDFRMSQQAHVGRTFPKGNLGKVLPTSA